MHRSTYYYIASEMLAAKYFLNCFLHSIRPFVSLLPGYQLEGETLLVKNVPVPRGVRSRAGRGCHSKGTHPLIAIEIVQ